jgi:hypothetical protein
MAEALLISRTDVVKFTAMNGNVDTDKFIQFIKIAQDVHIQTMLGTDLLNKIKADIVANTLANPYLALLTDYIKPMLIHWVSWNISLLRLTQLLTKGFISIRLRIAKM